MIPAESSGTATTLTKLASIPLTWFAMPEDNKTKQGAWSMAIIASSMCGLTYQVLRIAKIRWPLALVAFQNDKAKTTQQGSRGIDSHLLEHSQSIRIYSTII